MEARQRSKKLKPPYMQMVPSRIRQKLSDNTVQRHKKTKNTKGRKNTKKKKNNSRSKRQKTKTPDHQKKKKKKKNKKKNQSIREGG